MFNLFKPRKANPEQKIGQKPSHIAVVMDGNGRWANARGLSRVSGHKQGAESVKKIIKACIQNEIPYLTLFAFSSENWNRPKNEVSALMDLLSNALKTQTKKLNENDIRLNLIGDLKAFSPSIQELAEHAIELTKGNQTLTLTVAINYGGRWDMVEATKCLATKVANGELKPEQIDENSISEQLSTNDLPDPDLFIRTSGEYRISNFMLWQAAYSEFYFTDTLWPDFDEEAFTEALMRYTQRDRRFGNAVDAVSEGSSTEVADA